MDDQYTYLQKRVDELIEIFKQNPNNNELIQDAIEAKNNHEFFIIKDLIIPTDSIKFNDSLKKSDNLRMRNPENLKESFEYLKKSFIYIRNKDASIEKEKNLEQINSRIILIANKGLEKSQIALVQELINFGNFIKDEIDITINKYKKAPSQKLLFSALENISGIFVIIGIICAVIFGLGSMEITGNAIYNSNQTNSSIFGVLFLIIFFIAIFFYLKKIEKL